MLSELHYLYIHTIELLIYDKVMVGRFHFQLFFLQTQCLDICNPLSSILCNIYVTGNIQNADSL